MSDRPSDDGGSARSDAASRLAALLADVVEDPALPAESPREPGAPAPGPRRAVRRRDLVEPDTPADRGPAPPFADDGDDDPDATQPIPALARSGPEPIRAEPTPAEPTPAEEAAAARARQREEDVLAEARAFVRSGAGAPPVALEKPGKPRRRPVAPPQPPPAVSPPPAPTPAPVVFDDADDDDEADDVDVEPVAPAVAPAGRGDDGLAGRAPRLTLRAVAFGVALALLIGAVPVLGWVGSERLLDSKGGQVVEGSVDADEPDYRATVNPTATTLVVHRDAEGRPAAVAILALGAGDAGGTVILVPLGLQPADTSFFTRIIDGYDAVGSDDGFRRSIEDVIGISVPPPVVDVTDESLATLIAPVAPLDIDVTDPVVADNGIPYEGPVSLSAQDVGPYLRATNEGEPEIAHLERIRDVWVAWLEAIGSTTATEPIGAAATGMGSFLRQLAAGEPVVETLDVEEQLDYLTGASYVPAPGMQEQIIDAVPFPQSPRTGTRFNIELLNGARGETLPLDLMRDLVLAGGSLTTLGNAGAFGQEETVIVYKDDWQEEAEALQALLGDGVEIEEMSTRRADSQDDDMVITIGSDVLSRYEEQEDDGG